MRAACPQNQFVSPVKFASGYQLEMIAGLRMGPPLSSLRLHLVHTHARSVHPMSVSEFKYASVLLDLEYLPLMSSIPFGSCILFTSISTGFPELREEEFDEDIPF